MKVLNFVNLDTFDEVQIMSDSIPPLGSTVSFESNKDEEGNYQNEFGFFDKTPTIVKPLMRTVFKKYKVESIDITYEEIGRNGNPEKYRMTEYVNIMCTQQKD